MDPRKKIQDWEYIRPRRLKQERGNHQGKSLMKELLQEALEVEREETEFLMEEGSGMF